MGLYQRLITDDDHIAVHFFFAAIDLWADGDLTRAEVIAAFSLVGDEVTQLDAIKVQYDAAGGAAAKGRYVSKVHSVYLLAEGGFITTENKVNTVLGIA